MTSPCVEILKSFYKTATSYSTAAHACSFVQIVSSRIRRSHPPSQRRGLLGLLSAVVQVDTRGGGGGADAAAAGGAAGAVILLLALGTGLYVYRRRNSKAPAEDDVERAISKQLAVPDLLPLHALAPEDVAAWLRRQDLPCGVDGLCAAVIKRKIDGATLRDADDASRGTTKGWYKAATAPHHDRPLDEGPAVAREAPCAGDDGRRANYVMCMLTYFSASSSSMTCPAIPSGRSAISYRASPSS